jgi:CNT family concentrative nucleoside transporter
MGKVKLEVKSPYSNIIDAISHGASDGMKIAVNVIAMLIGFIASLIASRNISKIESYYNAKIFNLTEFYNNIITTEMIITTTTTTIIKITLI